ncbi:MAG: hypothetical protein JOZ72_03210 [Alphaproteobacteria bacterium]|nr:hypothetical protein [Alphaproteobacteria bacterium]
MKRLALAALMLSAVTAATAGDYSPPPPPPQKLITITSNLNTANPKAVYFPEAGRGIHGPQNFQGTNEVAWAAAFVSGANHLVTRIDVPILYFIGTPRIDVLLQLDKDGVPGPVLKTWHVKNVTNTHCCGLVSVTDAEGIPLHMGATYWVVVKSNAQGQDTSMLWMPNTVDVVTEGAVAFYCSSDVAGPACTQNDKWTSLTHAPALAFGVFGPD